MKCFFILAGLCSVLFVSGCDETKSIQWWNDHHTEAIKKETQCKKSGSDSRNCRNVREANFRWQQLHAKEPDWSVGADKVINGN
ncbi:EexN family lipoprotein [Pantoea stewartii]|uniref:EexN family lipoprotein n=1 Tax=Pantoea stewartii TaxID=66269 RepID=UPI0025A0C9A3|nr:EexN family lipoprotein [Pantoea stewartii]